MVMSTQTDLLDSLKLSLELILRREFSSKEFNVNVSEIQSTREELLSCSNVIYSNSNLTSVDIPTTELRSLLSFIIPTTTEILESKLNPVDTWLLEFPSDDYCLVFCNPENNKRMSEEKSFRYLKIVVNKQQKITNNEILKQIKQQSSSPNIRGEILALGIIGLVAFLINR